MLIQLMPKCTDTDYGVIASGVGLNIAKTESDSQLGQKWNQVQGGSNTNHFNFCQFIKKTFWDSKYLQSNLYLALDIKIILKS